MEPFRNTGIVDASILRICKAVRANCAHLELNNRSVFTAEIPASILTVGALSVDGMPTVAENVNQNASTHSQ
jgi:hypothetical protein